MVKSKIKLSIIIPSYNEINNLKYLLKQIKIILLKNKDLQIIIVDNGSTDGSKNYIEKNKKKFPKIKFIRVIKNIGYGYGIKKGLKFASGKIISWTHADLLFGINDIIKFFYKNYEKIINQDLLIKGRRQKRNLLDIFFTNGMSTIVNFLFKTDINDINGQPKMFDKNLIKKILKIGPNDFCLDLFLLLLASKNNITIKEFPLKVNNNRVNDKAKGGGSFFGKIKLTINTLRYIFVLYLNSNKHIWKL